MLEPIGRFLLRVGRLVLMDRAADPAANGEIQRNATHVKVYSGGAVRSMSDIGASPSHTHASHTGIGTGDHHAELHATAHQPAGADAMAVDAAAATGSLRTLGTTALKAAAGDHTHAGGGAETSAQAEVDTSETTTSASYTDLATAGPAVTLSPGSTQNQLIWAKCVFGTAATGPADFNVAVAGVAPSDAKGVKAQSVARIPGALPIFAASVPNGSTHTMKYKNDAATTSTYESRRILATTT